MGTIKSITLDEILESDLITGIIIKEDKELAEAGWTYEEIKEVAKVVKKK